MEKNWRGDNVLWDSVEPAHCGTDLLTGEWKATRAHSPSLLYYCTWLTVPLPHRWCRACALLKIHCIAASKALNSFDLIKNTSCMHYWCLKVISLFGDNSVTIAWHYTIFYHQWLQHNYFYSCFSCCISRGWHAKRTIWLQNATHGPALWCQEKVMLPNGCEMQPLKVERTNLKQCAFKTIFIG